MDQEYFDRLEPPDECEQDMLDLAASCTPKSRLGCQLRFTKKVDGIRLQLPEDVNNLFNV